MSLLNPIGLLGLLSILALIIIYIFKPKYQEKKISSTFIWKLSLKYKKRKLPLQWLQRSLLFMMQILILVFLTLLWTKPAFIFSLDNGEKIVILDASASMQNTSDGVTRFEKAVSEIKAMAERKNTNDRFTLIVATNEASFIVRRELSLAEITTAMDEVTCTYENANIESAILLANSVLDENVNADVILFSDHQYKDTGYITLRNMSNSEWNAAILDFTTELVDGYFVFQAEVASYNKDEYLTIDLFIDDVKQSTKIATCKNNIVTTLTWDDVNILSYDTAYIKINAIDSFPYDNEFYLFGGNRQDLKVQLVSPSPLFLFSMLKPLGVQIDVHYTYDAENFDNIQYEGYDLYIFDTFEMTTLPVDGAVWIINPIGEIPPETSLEIGNEIIGQFEATTSSSNNSEAFLSLTKDFSPSELEITKYIELLSYEGYEEILTIDEDPIILTRKTNGVKMMVFAFDLSHSNLPLLFLDFAALVRNMKNYSIAHTSDQLLYDVGQTAIINGKPDTTNLFLEYTNYFNVFSDTPVKHELVTPGIYTVSQTFEEKLDIVECFYVKVARTESDYATIGGVLAGEEYVNLEKGITGGSKNKIDFQDIITYIAGSLLVLLLVEWGLQYRELF